MYYTSVVDPVLTSFGQFCIRVTKKLVENNMLENVPMLFLLGILVYFSYFHTPKEGENSIKKGATFLMEYLYINQYTGYFIKVYRSLQVRVLHKILKYLSIQKLPQKRSHHSIYLLNSQKKIFILCFNFITNINKCKYIHKNIFE